MGCIYKITNTINNKCYIGQSINITARWQAHKNAVNSKTLYHYPLYRAFRKYGLENFTFTVIEECPVSQLNEKEIFWIQYYNSFLDKNKGYNL